MKRIILPGIFDAHAHLRHGDLMERIKTFYQFYETIVAMGNLPSPDPGPIVDAHNLIWYRNELEYHCAFPCNIVYSVMLVNKTTPEILYRAYGAGAQVLKLIPGGTSTNSDDGVSLYDLKKFYPVIETAGNLGMIFSVHFELAAGRKGGKIDELKREEKAIPFVKQLIRDFPGLPIVVEHASTEKMINLVWNSPDNVAATLTAHHPKLTIGDVRDKNGKITHPENYCKPIAKTERDRKAVVKAMVSGNKKFFFGSDSAPHYIAKKMGDNPAAGIFTAPVAIPILCEIFEEQNALDKLPDFVSHSGRAFYDLALSKKQTIMKKEDWAVPCGTSGEQDGIFIFMGGKVLSWQYAE